MDKTINKLNTFRFIGLTFIAMIFLFSGCQRDESVLNDYDLFGRLQRGNGTWRVVQVETFQNDVPNPTITTTVPTQETVYHFFIRSLEVQGILIDVATASYYVGPTLTGLFDCAAEKERVVFSNGQIFGGTVFTVEENKPDKQVWNYTEGDNTTRITMERCNCEVPFISAGENGG